MNDYPFSNKREEELHQLTIQIQHKLTNIGKKIKKKTYTSQTVTKSYVEYRKLKSINYEYLKHEVPKSKINFTDIKQKQKRIRKSASVAGHNNELINNFRVSAKKVRDRNALSISNDSINSLNSYLVKHPDSSESSVQKSK
jgi:N-glycosylase/DNA lyase